MPNIEKTRKHLINLHNSDAATLERIKKADYKNGEIVVQHGSDASSSAIHILNNEQTNVVTFVPKGQDDSYLGKTAKAADSELLDGKDSAQFATAEGLTNLTVRVTAAEEQIVENSKVSAAGIAQNKTAIDANTASIEINASEISGLDTRLTTTEGEINALQSKKLESGDIPNLATDKITALTGFADASEYADVSATDSLNTALGKLSKGHKDQTAKITDLESAISGGTFFKGVVSTFPETSKNGDIIAIKDATTQGGTDISKYNGKEFIWHEEQATSKAPLYKWVELGDSTADQQRISALEGYFDEGVANSANHVTSSFTLTGAGTTAASFNGSAAKSVNIAAGSNVSVTGASGEITISASTPVTDNNPTLDWSTKSLVATVDGKEIHATMPEKPYTEVATSGITGVTVTDGKNLQTINFADMTIDCGEY